MIDLTKQAWRVWLGDFTQEPEQPEDIVEVMLPGSLDEFAIGHPDRLDLSCHPDEGTGQTFDSDEIATRFTRKYTYEGPACFARELLYQPGEGKRVFLEVERGRCLRLFLDGCEAAHARPANLCTPHLFEVTELLKGGTQGEASACSGNTLGAAQLHRIVIESDNSYPGLPHDSIVYSSAATDETQTNWNGLLGRIQLIETEAAFISALRVYPKQTKGQAAGWSREGLTLTVQAEIDAAEPVKGILRLSSEALLEPWEAAVCVPAGKTVITAEALELRADAALWDEYQGNLYRMTASLHPETGQSHEKTVSYGIRVFGDDGAGHLALNGRRIFVRSEANCAEFPETGYIPMEKGSWRSILQRYKSYGVNLMRFHSHCPPEGAFEAADEMGMLMQPELSHWNPKNAFEFPESIGYYTVELAEVIRMLANHPSFVMLTFGNELHCGALGTERMHGLLKLAKEMDDTRLYANASNAHYGNEGCDEESDFYASQSYYQHRIRATLAGNPETPEEAAAVEAYEKAHGTYAKVNLKGYLNNQYPSAKTNYDETLREIRKTYDKPVFSFEVGQYEILPDFDELRKFQGISDPANYRRIQRMVKEKGLEPVWKQYVEATGELSLLCYREEIEAALRTEDLSGISLLGLQDFPGQGTALVGMLDAHLDPKPFAFAQPERFAGFFREQLPLVLLERYTYENHETLRARVKVANYGKQALEGCLSWQLGPLSGSTAEIVSCPPGALTEVGEIVVSLEGFREPVKQVLSVSLGTAVNAYPIWIYPGEKVVRPEAVYETRVLDAAARKQLMEGGIVYYSPDSTQEALPNSIRGQFSTDFWSVGTFGRQEGGMGQLIDSTHPIFQQFPSEKHTNWQWWPMAGQRAVILPKPIPSIITEMDSYAFLRPMTQLFECRVGKGRLLYSTLGLQQLQQYPEARALSRGIYRYLVSDQFAPTQEMTREELTQIGQK